MHELVGEVANNGKTFATVAGSTALLGGTAFKAFTIIGENERGIRVRRGNPLYEGWLWGKTGELRGVVGKGLHFVIPLTHSIRKVSIKEHDNDLSTHFMSEGTKMEFRSSFRWAIQDDPWSIYRAVFTAENESELSQIMTSAGRSAVRQTLRQLTDEEQMHDETLLFAGLQAGTAEVCHKYGTAIRGFSLESIVPVDAEVHRNGIREGISEAFGSVLRSQLPGQLQDDIGRQSA